MFGGEAKGTFHENIKYSPNPNLVVTRLDGRNFNFSGLTIPVSPNLFNQDKGRLWSYNLHYFEYLPVESNLSEKNLKFWTNLMADWILNDEKPNCLKSEPYVVSRRIVSWLKFVYAQNLQKYDRQLIPQIANSLASQTSSLSISIEWHLRGNHLISNARALIFSGLLIRSQLAQGWLDKGFDLLLSQMNEQIMNSGEHFEKSPMYHQSVLCDLLDVYDLTTQVLEHQNEFNLSFLKMIQAQSVIAENICRMLSFSRMITHTDGSIARFNDSAPKVYPSLATTLKVAESLIDKSLIGLGKSHEDGPKNYQSELGFIRIECGKMCLLADIGGLNPHYQPGHFHSGDLSFELSAGPELFLCNVGVSSYDDLSIRSYERSSAAHNTVVLDSLNSSEVWSQFRVGRRSKVSRYERCFARECRLTYSAKSEHYFHRAWRKAFHVRTFSTFSKFISISDQVGGARRASMFLHVASGIRVQDSVETATGNGIRAYYLIGKEGFVIVKIYGAGDVLLSDGYVAHDFGSRVPSTIIEVVLSTRFAEIQLSYCELFECR